MLWRTRVRWQVRQIRDRFRKWCDRHGWCALFPAWWTRLTWRDRQPASYSLAHAQNTTTFAKWLAGLSGAAVVLACAYYMQAYLSVLSIKDDCVSRRFVADAIYSAATFLIWAIAAGLLALAAIVWPAVVRGWRNGTRRMAAKPPLQPGHEFDGLSEGQVRWRLIPQGILVLLSGASLATLIVFLIWFGVTIGGRPEGVQKMWHDFELKCLPKPPE